MVHVFFYRTFSDLNSTPILPLFPPLRSFRGSSVLTKNVNFLLSHFHKLRSIYHYALPVSFFFFSFLGCLWPCSCYPEVRYHQACLIISYHRITCYQTWALTADTCFRAQINIVIMRSCFSHGLFSGPWVERISGECCCGHFSTYF